MNKVYEQITLILTEIRTKKFFTSQQDELPIVRISKTQKKSDADRAYLNSTHPKIRAAIIKSRRTGEEVEWNDPRFKRGAGRTSLGDPEATDT